MAMTVTIKPALTNTFQHSVSIRGNIVFSGSYSTGGEAWDLTKFVGVPVKKQDPASVAIWGKGDSNHIYGFVPGSDLTGGKVKLTVGTTGAELAAGAYPAGVTGDVIEFEVLLPKYV